VHDLMAYAEPLSARLPLDPDEEDIVLDAELLPAPPAELRSGGLTIAVSASGRDYGNVRRDLVWLTGQRPDFRALGLVVFASLFHDQPVTVQCAGPDSRWVTGSRLERLVVNEDQLDRDDPMPHRLVSRPMAYNYWPHPDHPLHPFEDATRTEYHLEGTPGFRGVSDSSAELRLLVGDDPYR
jgi:hypothetical protein